MLAFNTNELNKALEALILSPSGWRTVFADAGAGSEQVDEESATRAISAAHRVIVRRAAAVFAQYLVARKTDKQRPLVAVGMDTRPTGPAIADEIIDGLLAADCDVEFTGIVAAPEIMAYAKGAGISGFVYISASHNPIGHNGLKFGLNDGGVLAAPEAEKLIAAFRANHDAPQIAAPQAAGVPVFDAVIDKETIRKRAAYQAYLDFTREVVRGGSVGASEYAGGAGEYAGGADEYAGGADILAAISSGLHVYPVGIAADFNGSARTVSIDREFFEAMGLGFHAINEKPGAIAHRIVPEGESLEPCRQFLEALHAKDPSVTLGYVPDCDGDRGNLVIWDEAAKQARSLEAQEVFALACVGEFAHLVWSDALRYDDAGRVLSKAAIAVNDPTSMRVDRIAQAFGVSVFHAEVGEANVVSLARELRERGYLVRILGEGSAGGNITHPSAVRDPLNTVAAIIKLLCVRGAGGRAGLFEIWCTRTGREYRGDFSLSDVIASLPAFHTTGSYTPEAMLRVKTADHAALKDRYQAVFLRDWELRKGELREKYGITQWAASCYNGVREKRGLTCFGEAGRGGLKVTFADAVVNERAWIWMRGSGTEPVFRVMADAEGTDIQKGGAEKSSALLERELIEWQRRMVIEADSVGVTGCNAGAAV
jgi:phosphoglucomutase